MNKKGITLIALVATIVIMLILTGITFGAINGGLFDYAGRAKTSVEETSIKSKIGQAYMIAKGESKTNIVSEHDMQEQVDKEFPNENATVVEEGDKFIVIIDDKYYEVDNDGDITGPGKLEAVPNAGDITKGGTCTGTQAKPYRIECIEDLVELSRLAYNDLAKDRNKYYILTKDLDFNSIFSYSDYRAKYSYSSEQNAYIPDETSETTIKELCTTGQGFIPIGYTYGSSGGTKVFQGIFYADSQTEIRNIHIEKTGNAGLFGACKFLTIRNITVTGHIVSTDGCAAGIVAQGHNLTINKCNNKAKIEGNGDSAGILTQYSTSTTITGCINYGDISSENGRANGITYNGILDRCINLGDVTGYGNSARNSAQVILLKIVLTQEQ